MRQDEKRNLSDLFDQALAFKVKRVVTRIMVNVVLGPLQIHTIKYLIGWGGGVVFLVSSHLKWTLHHTALIIVPSVDINGPLETKTIQLHMFLIKSEVLRPPPIWNEMKQEKHFINVTSLPPFQNAKDAGF